MNIANRSYLTAGIAALGASAVALAPIQPIHTDVALEHQPAVANLAVSLASTIDPITPWVDTFKLAAENLAQLSAFYKEQPLPLIQTIGANIQTYIQEASNGNANLIPQQIANNARTFFEAPWWNETDNPIINDNTFASEYISNTTTGAITVKIPPLSIPLSHQGLFGLLPVVLSPEQQASLKPILEFVATPYGGQLAGFVAPFIGTVAQLTTSFTKVGLYFKNGDLIGALNELINIPANMTNAFLNGYGNLDLTAVVSGLLPPEIKSFGLNLGGWISPPVPKDGSLVTPVVTPTKYGIGTLFDAVSVTAEASLGQLTGEAATPGLPTSAAGANIGLGQFLADALLVTPPTSTAAVHPTASVRAAAAVEAPASEIEVPAAVEAPAAPEVSAPAPEKKAASSDNGRKADNAGRGHHSGARGD